MLVEIQRCYLDDATVGVLTFGDYKCCTIELPWRDNQRRISCIPAGRYICKNNHSSPSQGLCISIQGVAERDHILIHVANWARNVLGCIGVGDKIQNLNSEPMVTNSKNTLSELMRRLPDEFILVIK